ncbi:MAG: hypothetical protein AAGF01_30205 [Cyanobacteria bacterium P01_G01_bin.38]
MSGCLGSQGSGPSNVLLRDRTARSAGAVYLVDFGSVQNLVAAEGGTITTKNTMRAIVKPGL